MTSPKSSRIESLDQFRGYTVVGMLLVNFGGGFAALPAVLKHHNTYCSYADTIMPQFFFAVGFALRLVLLRNMESLGAPAAYRRTLRRIAMLVLLGVVFYNLNKNWLEVAGWRDPRFRELLAASWWRNSFQTLVHIGVTCLWLLPFIARPTRMRLAVAAFSGLLHLGLSAWFWYGMLHEKRVIDGGPLGFLTWTLPVVAGSIASDWVRNSGPRGAILPLVVWGFAAMLGGYGVSCFGVGGPLAALPFFPPVGDVDLWTMSQRAGSLSYLLFASGFSMAVYALFIVACDVGRCRLALFAVFGKNALTAYILHELIGIAFSPIRQKDAPLWIALLVIVAYVAVNALVLAGLTRRKWVLRL